MENVKTEEEEALDQKLQAIDEKVTEAKGGVQSINANLGAQFEHLVDIVDEHHIQKGVCIRTCITSLFGACKSHEKIEENHKVIQEISKISKIAGHSKVLQKHILFQDTNVSAKCS